MTGRKLRPGPQTDLQSRIRFIEEQCQKLKKDVMEGEVVAPLAVAALADAVDYLAKILDKHLRDDER